MKVIAAEVAAHLGMLTRKAATESRATTGEMASAGPYPHPDTIFFLTSAG